MRKETKCVQTGNYIDAATGGLNTPIFTSTSYEYLDRGKVPYQRYFNTMNQEAVVRKVADLEGAESGLLFSSGMAAISTVILALARAGEKVLLMDELYGGTHAFADDQLGRFGIDCAFAATDADAICKAIDDRTRVVVIESPTNPLLNVVDIRKVAEYCRERGVITVIDNTFATPINQNPIALGIDVVVHSGTKYLGGHSDIQCGIAVACDELTDQILVMARNLGGSLNASVCYLLERSLKTLAIRVERQSENALKIAEHLSSLPEVRSVRYPGLKSSPGHKIAASQMTGFGGVLSFELSDAAPDASEFLRRLKLIIPAVSLGGVEATICSPAETSHAAISHEDRARIGVTDALLRLSVGVEHVDDIIADLTQAMDRDQ